MKKFIVVEYFESYKHNLVEAENEKEASDIIYNDEEHNGEIVDVYEQ